ncbi:hypothetical protein [Kitasatospora sp. DSM 101779]|uniref:hypothetical protein n=1 Tax=Kitasatospora sp. DSM 101779 TaxID=2853165 RepID=UPI0021D9D74D|nr:hypothetical protein [Kitasatospora sp. DSM 101779]MCU7825126.1 hypothetical protein [Kitasatospora sp. DSM 101779]
MEKLLALLVKGVIGGAVRLLLGWVGVRGRVAAAVLLVVAICWCGRVLIRRRAARVRSAVARQR